MINMVLKNTKNFNVMILVSFFKNIYIYKHNHKILWIIEKNSWIIQIGKPDKLFCELLDYSRTYHN